MSKLKNLENSIRAFESEGFIAAGRSDLKPYVISIPFQWNIDPFNDKNWQFQLHTLRYLSRYLDMYKQTKSLNYLDKITAYFIDWFNFNLEFPSDFTWHDMATGIRSEKLYELQKTLITSDTSEHSLETLESMRKLHVEKLCEPGFINKNHNHGLHSLHGLRCLVELEKDAVQKKQLVDFCNQTFSEIFYNQLNDEFIHKEHSPHYHIFFVKIIDQFIKSGFYTLNDELSAALERARLASRFMTTSDNREIPFGDTDNCIVSNIESNNKDYLVEIEYFSSSDYAVVKELGGNNFFAITNTYYSKVHKHADNLSFVWSCSGNDIFVDAGKYKYDEQDPIRSLVKSAVCHNTLLPEGKSWDVSNLISKSNTMYSYMESGLFIAHGKVDIKRDKKRFSLGRSAFYLNNAFLVLIDCIFSDTAHLVDNHTVVFNMFPTLKLSIGVNACQIIAENNSPIVTCSFFSDGCLEPNMPITEPSVYSPQYARYESSLRLKLMFNTQHVSIFTLIDGDCSDEQVGNLKKELEKLALSERVLEKVCNVLSKKVV